MEISVYGLMRLDSPKIVDIRSSDKFYMGHIPGSINIPYQDLILNPSRYLNVDNVYYLYCQKGITSLKCMYNLRDKGYDVISVAGGYDSFMNYS